jgi:hypothetical protein
MALYFLPVQRSCQGGRHYHPSKNTIGNYQPEPLLLCFNKLFFKIFHVGIFIPVALRFAEPDAIDYGCMVECIGDYCILFGEQRLKTPPLASKQAA